MNFNQAEFEKLIDEIRQIDSHIEFYRLELKHRFNLDAYKNVMFLLYDYTQKKDRLRDMMKKVKRLPFKESKELQDLVQRKIFHCAMKTKKVIH